MATSIKGITVEIGGDTTKLSKSLEDVNKTLKNTQGDLKQVDRLLKLDPKNTELLAQKQRLLSKAVGDTKDKLKILQTAADQAKHKLEIGEISRDQYDALVRKVVETKEALKKLEAQTDSTGSRLRSLVPSLKDVGQSAEAVANKTKGLSLAAAGGVTALAGLAIKAGVAADDLNTLAKQSGFSTEQIQTWQYAADRIDVDVNTIISSAKRMKKNMVSTSTEVQGAWAQLGISVTDGSGQLRDATEVFNQAVYALSQVQNETERDTIAIQLFGRNADELAGIIDDGGAALREFGEEAKASGLILSQDALDAANEFNDGVDRLKATAKQAFFETGASIAEDLIPMMDTLVEKFVKLMEWVSSIDGETLTFVGTLLLLIAAISPVAGGLANIIKLVTTIPALFSATNIKLMATVGAFVLLAGTIAAVSSAWDKMDNAERVLAVLGAVAVAASAAAIALGAITGPAGAALAAAGIVAGVAMAGTAIARANKRAKAASPAAIPYGPMDYTRENNYGRGGSAATQNVTIELDGNTLGRTVLPYLNQEQGRISPSLVGG